MESEMIALATAGKEPSSLRCLLAEIPLWEKPLSAVLIHCDSTATIAKIDNRYYKAFTLSTTSPNTTTHLFCLSLLYNVIPLSTFLPPLYTRPTPNFAQVPPHLRIRITPPRCSMRVQFGIGTSKSKNPKPHYFIISDSKSDDSSDSCPPVAKSPTQPEPPIKTKPTATTPPPQHPSTTTKTSTPSKSAFSSKPSHSTPPHQKRRSINDTVSPPTNQKEPLSQPKPQTKNMKTKITMTIAQFLARKILPNPQRRKTLAPKQNLKKNGNAVQHHTDVLGWTSFLRISESYFPDVVRAFYYNAKTFADKSLIISTIKGVEIKLTPDILATILQLPTKGPSVFGDHWYSVLGLRKTEVLANLFEENSTRHLATYLKPLPKVFNNMCQHTLIPHCGSHEYVSDNDALLIHHLLNCKRLNLTYVILQHMICAANKDYKKNTVPYGMVLTIIFSHFGVSLASEKSLIKISKFSTKNLSHMRKTSSAPTPTPPSSGRRPPTNPISFSSPPTDPKEISEKIPTPEQSPPTPEQSPPPPEPSPPPPEPSP
uniref:Uncharacterized protein LOC101494360 n=1 Tax=Cicer arietinum TaxID=3827 RepID=A0A1S2Z4X3_CICAR|nr:uncharacterized protein LOC101494360 [Cicer arietinum]